MKWTRKTGQYPCLVSSPSQGCRADSFTQFPAPRVYPSGPRRSAAATTSASPLPEQPSQAFHVGAVPDSSGALRHPSGSLTRHRCTERGEPRCGRLEWPADPAFVRCPGTRERHPPGKPGPWRPQVPIPAGGRPVWPRLIRPHLAQCGGVRPAGTEGAVLHLLLVLPVQLLNFCLKPGDVAVG